MPTKNPEGEILYATTGTEAGAIIEALENAQPYAVVGVHDGVQVLVVKDGHKVTSVKPHIDEYRTAPERRKGTAVFSDLASFIAHANRFRDADSVVFANDSRTSPSLTSVLDYHRATAEGAPRFGQHRGSYAFPLSDEWKAWTEQNAKAMTQAEFARFIEDRLVDVMDPASLTEGGSAAHWAGRLGVTFATPSQLLELSRGLAAKVSSHVRGSHDTASGTKEVMFASEVTDPNGAPLPVPGAFLLSIPVFKRGDLYPVPVRLRFRIKESVTWSYELARVDAVFEHAFAEACDHVAKLTTLPVLRGDAER